MAARQVESLDRIDRILRTIAGTMTDSRRELVAAVTGDISPATKRAAFPAIIETGVARVRRMLADQFRRHAAWAHDSATDAMMDAIPLPFLLSRVPPDTRAAFEAIHHPRSGHVLNFDAGTLWASLESEVDELDPFADAIPIEPLGELKLTDDEVKELIRKIVFPPPSADDVTAALRTSDWEDRLESLSKRISDKQIAFNEIVTGYSEGEGIRSIRKRLEPLVDGIQSSAQRIARTEGMRVAETMQRRSWGALGDMMTGVQIIAVLDERTRTRHATRNGTIYYKSPRGNQKSMAELPDLPDEPNCRCMTSPVLEPPEEIKNDPAIREAFRQTTGAGRVDPETQTKWFRSADPDKRKQVVGAKRYREVQKLIGDREPEWSDFIDEEGRLLSIGQLQNETVAERLARKELIDRQIERRGRAIRELSRRGFEWPAAKRSSDGAKKPAAKKKPEPTKPEPPKPEPSKPKKKRLVDPKSAGTAKDYSAAMKGAGPDGVKVLTDMQARLTESGILADIESANEKTLDVSDIRKAFGDKMKPFKKEIERHEKAVNEWQDGLKDLLKKRADGEITAEEQFEERRKLSKKLRKKYGDEQFERARRLQPPKLDVEPREVLAGIVNPDGSKRDKIKFKSGTKKKELREKSNEAAKWLNRVIPDDAPVDLEFELKYEKGRAYAQPKARTIHMDESHDVGIHVHEIAHIIERHVGDSEAAARAMRHKMSEGQRAEHLRTMTGDNGFKDWEVSAGNKVGGFEQRNAAYVLKYYEGNEHTEVISMGVEQLYRDPIKLADQNPEYFDFLVNVLRGNYGR